MTEQGLMPMAPLEEAEERSTNDRKAAVKGVVSVGVSIGARQRAAGSLAT